MEAITHNVVIFLRLVRESWFGWPIKLLAQNSTEDAIAAMERLVDLFGETGGEFLFDANYILGQAKQQERSYQQAVDYFESALANSSWHDSANDARIRLGESLYEVGQASKDSSLYDRAVSSFTEVKSDTDATLEQRGTVFFHDGRV